MSCYIIAVIIGLAGQALAKAIHFGLGSPIATTGEYISGMLFSSVGRWIIERYDKFEQRMNPHSQKVNPWKLFTCPTCLSVWVTILLFFSVTSLPWQLVFVSLGASHYFVTKR